MGFFRRKLGFVIGILCFLALIGLLWFCLFYRTQNKEPEGTLVSACRITGQKEVAA